MKNFELHFLLPNEFEGYLHGFYFLDFKHISLSIGSGFYLLCECDVQNRVLKTLKIGILKILPLNTKNILEITKLKSQSHKYVRTYL